MKPGGYNETWAEWTATAKPQMVETKPHFLHRNIKAAGFHLNSFKSFWQTCLYSVYWLLYVLIYILFLINEYIFSSVQNNFKTQDCIFWIMTFWDFVSMVGGMAGELRTMDSYMLYPVFRRAWELDVCQLSAFIWSPAHWHLVPTFIALCVLGS